MAQSGRKMYYNYDYYYSYCCYCYVQVAAAGLKLAEGYALHRAACLLAQVAKTSVTKMVEYLDKILLEAEAPIASNSKILRRVLQYKGWPGVVLDFTPWQARKRPKKKRISCERAGSDDFMILFKRGASSTVSISRSEAQ